MKLYFLMDPMVLAGLMAFGFAVASILVEALVLLLFRLNGFGKCLLDSLMANIGFFLLAVLLVLAFNKSEFEGVSQTTELFVLYVITVLLEGWIIKLLNAKLGWGRILVASLIMNLVSFGALYFYVTIDISF